MISINSRTLFNYFNFPICIFIGFLLLSNIECDVIRFGSCPPVRVQSDFQNKMFTGVWYEIVRNPMLALINTKCNRMEIQMKGAMFTIKNSLFHKTFGKNITFDGKAFANNTNDAAKLTVQYPLALFRLNLAIPYWILYSDYNTAVVWACLEHFKMLHIEYFWVLSRTKTLSDDRLDQLLDKLNEFGINTSYYVRTEQDCK